MSTMDRYADDVRAAHPYPTDDPVQRLRHTVVDVSVVNATGR